MKQIHITQIENGWLVMTPPKPNTVKFLNQGQEQQPQPNTHFCGDMVEVCSYLQSLDL